MKNNPKTNANKGWAKEIAKVQSGKAPTGKSSPQVAAPKPFTWAKPVVRAQTTDAMATPHRLTNMKAVKPSKSSFVSEKQAHQDKKSTYFKK